jgi:cation transport protein ChaC
MRFGQERFAELDAQAAIEGWPPGWRMNHKDREENRHSVLSGRLGEDLWVFAYGSLIWDPAVQVEEYRLGRLVGWRRSFCMRIEGGRGTRERPGLMAALEQGDQCDGVVFRIPGHLVDQETEFMWRREMFSGTYLPVFKEVVTLQGRVEALVFVMDCSNYRYVRDMTQGEAAQIIATAEGRLGPNFSYLDALVHHLSVLGIEDSEMIELHHLAGQIREEELVKRGAT